MRQLESVLQVGGDTDIAMIGALVADPGRCRILLALDDGRALPASHLAAEAGVSPATASSHLGKLTEAGLLAVEARGRHRYYHLAGPAVAHLIEALQQLAPAAPIRSLRQESRARALREARTCYDHLAGRLGVELMSAMIERGHLSGGDGTFDLARAHHDQPTGYGHDVDYTLTESGEALLTGFGLHLPICRRPVRYCVDWSEQRHHLAGALGRGLLGRFTQADWIRRTDTTRAVRLTDIGRQSLHDLFGVDLTSP
ncbi:ArsR/SmtB family transcription factor [Streptosporangium lutulentum]|uniref:DNA-binding transcriptional ArsR family regulator n=1 Tax=Streptosporangium lutulentum TaxID=1461250 RepID=A0ABT9QDQ1_9ACTN|nr:metalloregulator ArsR/SmtB family transcription factor [Streptosporangium lutulentum]MDP9844074.1 DNA-binding transcriptional ArsR family regulator [Streptosporangium lutulentum]